MSDEISNALFILIKELQVRVGELETDVDRVLFLMNEQLSNQRNHSVTRGK